MKKVLSLILVAGFIFAFSSCSKDYTCECVTTMTGVDPVSSEATAEFSSKSDAEEWCDEGDMEIDILGIITKIECEIK